MEFLVVFWSVGTPNVLVFRPRVVVWKPPAACRPPGFKQAHFRSRPTKTPPKFHEKIPQREKKSEIWSGRGKKRAKFWAVRRREVLLRWVRQILDAPTKILNTPPTHPTSHNKTTQDTTRHHKTPQDTNTTHKTGLLVNRSDLFKPNWPKALTFLGQFGLKRSKQVANLFRPIWPKAVLAQSGIGLKRFGLKRSLPSPSSHHPNPSTSLEKPPNLPKTPHLKPKNSLKPPPPPPPPQKLP